MGLYDGGDCTIKFIEAEYSFHTQSRGTSTDFPSPRGQGQGHIPGSTNTGLDKGENDFLGALRREAAGAGCLFSGFSHGQWVYIVKHPIDGEPCAQKHNGNGLQGEMRILQSLIEKRTGPNSHTARLPVSRWRASDGSSKAGCKSVDGKRKDNGHESGQFLKG